MSAAAAVGRGSCNRSMRKPASTRPMDSPTPATAASWQPPSSSAPATPATTPPHAWLCQEPKCPKYRSHGELAVGL